MSIPSSLTENKRVLSGSTVAHSTVSSRPSTPNPQTYSNKFLSFDTFKDTTSISSPTNSSITTPSCANTPDSRMTVSSSSSTEASSNYWPQSPKVSTTPIPIFFNEETNSSEMTRKRKLSQLGNDFDQYYDSDSDFELII